MGYFLENETYLLNGCCMKVHSELGNGFLEKVYQEALEIEFKESGIPFVREARLRISYRGHQLVQEYIADFVCYDNIILEIKAVSSLNEVHTAQLLNYLKATGLKLGILVNFGESSLVIKRVYNFNSKN